MYANTLFKSYYIPFYGEYSDLTLPKYFVIFQEKCLSVIGYAENIT